jgi:hypothetical protein
MAPYQKIRSLLLGLAFVLSLFLGGSATLITGAGDAALAGALVQDFNAEPTDTFFTSRTFLIGIDGFTITPLSGDLHLDDQFCASFGTSSNCLDTIMSSNQANDDFDVVFTGGGVSRPSDSSSTRSMSTGPSRPSI